MNTSQIRFDRLLQLADHLERGQLGHKTFDFSQWTDSVDNSCGTAGCAIGECPILWPNDWEYRTDELGSSPVLKTSPFDHDPGDSGTEWFGLSRDASVHLFVSGYQATKTYGGMYLKSTATKEQVAANIRAFCAKLAPSSPMP